MSIENISLSRLRNEEHFQFQAEFNDLLVEFNPGVLGIETLYGVYEAYYNNERLSLDLIRKSAITDDLSDADSLRDATFRGMADAIKSARNHFSPAVRQAALRVQVLFDHYGNVAIRPYNEESAAINSLINELNEHFGADKTTLNLDGWINELQTNNEAFDALIKSRYSEEAGKPQFRMKQMRIQTDTAYRKIVKRINALIEVNGESAYLGFVNELNSRIVKYSTLLAQREGRNGKEKPQQDPDKS